MRIGGILALTALLAGGCTTAPARQDAARPTAWRIAAVADAPAEPVHKAAAAAILAYFQDTEYGGELARATQPLCLGIGPASGGPFIAQPLDDLAADLLVRIAAARPNVRGVSECATTMKGAPYRIEKTGEPAYLIACLHTGDAAPTISLLCGWYDGPLMGDFVGYDATVAADAAIVRRNGRGLSF